MCQVFATYGWPKPAIDPEKWTGDYTFIGSEGTIEVQYRGKLRIGRGDAWETPVMKKYVAGFPAAAVARDQLPFAVAELSTHENQRVTKALNDGLQAALTGAKTPAQAMQDAQREAERILKPYRR